jgi:hypothetical protein
MDILQDQDDFKDTQPFKKSPEIKDLPLHMPLHCHRLKGIVDHPVDLFREPSVLLTLQETIIVVLPLSRLPYLKSLERNTQSTLEV